MAHSKSALKRWRQSLVNRDRNRSVKSQTRTLLNKAVVAIETDASSAEDAVREAVSALDKAAQKGVIHTNAAARGKSRLLKRYNLATATAVASAAAGTAAAEEKPAARGRAAPKKDAKPAPRGKAAPKANDKPAARRTRKN
ncbi:MAG TPA: 30S ribosomal protein S20 [Dehalococcoidia bacterium]|nr:30S ribosomal protein S20 [Dehalococcoidia bacterium]